MFSETVKAVVASFRAGSNVPKVYQKPEEIKAVLSAIDCGLCRLVKNTSHTITLYDKNWNVTLGVELTHAGREFLMPKAA